MWKQDIHMIDLLDQMSFFKVTTPAKECKYLVPDTLLQDYFGTAGVKYTEANSCAAKSNC